MKQIALLLLAALTFAVHAATPAELKSAQMQGHLTEILVGAKVTYLVNVSSETGISRLPRIGLRANFCTLENVDMTRPLIALVHDRATVVKAEMTDRWLAPPLLSLTLDDGHILRCGLTDVALEEDMPAGFMIELPQRQ